MVYEPAVTSAGGWAVTWICVEAPASTTAVAAWLELDGRASTVQPVGPEAWSAKVCCWLVSLLSVRSKR